MKKAICYYFAYLLSSIAGGIIFAIVARIFIAIFFPQHQNGINVDDIAYPWCMGFALIGAQIATIMAFMKHKMGNYSWGNLHECNNMKAVFVLSAILGLGLFLAFSIVPVDPSEYNKLFPASLTTNPIFIISVCFGAPLSEELVFRGGIERVLLNCKSNLWIAIMVSAAAFALTHGNMVQSPFALALGIVIGWIYYRTGSVWPGICIHFVNNTLASVINLANGGSGNISLDMTTNVCITIAGILIIVITMKYLVPATAVTAPQKKIS